MKYEVRIVITEQYSTIVMADSEEAAKEIAMDRLNNGMLDVDYGGLRVEIEPQE